MNEQPSEQPKHAGGRPPKYSPELLAKICEAIAAGATAFAAAGAQGVTRQILYKWREDHPEIFDAIACARDECAARMARELASAAPADWRAAESWLKRRCRDEWGDSIDVRRLDDDSLTRLLNSAVEGPEAAESPGDRRAAGTNANEKHHYR